jgi:hypothetical protein
MSGIAFNVHRRQADFRPDGDEVVGVFPSTRSFQAAVDALLTSGFDRADLGMLASHRVSWKARTRGLYDVRTLEDDPTAPRAAYMGRDSVIEAMTGLTAGVGYVAALAATGVIIAAEGTVAATYAGAAAFGALGGLLGAWIARRVGGRYGRELREQLEHGGIPLWIAAHDEAHKKRALRILDRHGALDVHAKASFVGETPSTNPLSGVMIDPFLPQARI